MGDGWVGEKITKLLLHSTLVEIEVEVGVELGNCTILDLIVQYMTKGC